MKHVCIGLAGLVLAGCAIPGDPAATTPPPGSNQMLRAPISGAAGYEVIISDVVIPAGEAVPRHYHPGEEFLYLIEGSAIHVEEGKPDIELKAGDAYVIEPEAIHAPRGGPDGARAIVFRAHVAGKPERILVEGAEVAPHSGDHPHGEAADHQH